VSSFHFCAAYKALAERYPFVSQTRVMHLLTEHADDMPMVERLVIIEVCAPLYTAAHAKL
jgi:hypothetical protein